MKWFTSIMTLAGTLLHYDENNNCVGESVPGILPGEMKHYDANGNYAGRTDEGMVEGLYVTRDGMNNIVGTSYEAWDGSYRHHGPTGSMVGQSVDTLGGVMSSSTYDPFATTKSDSQSIFDSVDTLGSTTSSSVYNPFATTSTDEQSIYDKLTISFDDSNPF